ncbi:Superkiller protein 3, partial [Linderina macrospora]
MSVIFKAKLKNAKSAIADKNYDYAYDLCHDLLELDDKNYNVHILLGVSCQHMEKWDEGEKVYRAAMSMPKANLLAWQGLCALFENANMADKYRGALAEMRDKCMGEGNTAKAWEAMSKILKLSEDSGDQRSLIGVLRELAPAGKFNTLLEETGGEQTPPSAGEVLQRVFTIERDLEQKTIEREVNKRKTRLGAGPITKVRKDVRMEIWADSSMLDTLSQLISFYSDESSLEKRLEYEECYFEALLERAATYDNAQQKSSMGEEAQRVAWDLASNGRSQAAFEHLIELADSSNDDDNLRGLADGYLQMFPSGRLAKSAQLWVQLEDGETNDDAIEAAQQGRDAASDSPFAYVLLVRLAIRSKMFRLAADSGVASRSVLGGFCARYGVALPHSQLTIDLGVADAYMGLGLEDVSEAEKLYRRCLEADPGNARAVLGLGLSLCSLGNFEESKQLLETALETDPSNHLALGGLGRVLMAEGNVAVAVDYFIKAIAVSSNYADHHIYLGNAYWEMGGQHQEDKQYAYSSWISAAKIDPDTSQTFCGLGQWYQQFGHDESRAKKCFAKAFQLNNADSQAGQALAQIYLSEGSDDLCEAMLVKATDSQYNQKWAWKLLGFLRLRQDQSEQAIVAFRNALTVDRTDRLCWEGLCEAYMAIGRLDTCVKVARKVIELDPERLSGYWLGAKAAMAANEYREALGMFDRAIGRADQPDNEAAVAVWRRTLLISKAECLVMLAAQWHEEGFFGR